MVSMSRPWGRLAVGLVAISCLLARSAAAESNRELTAIPVVPGDSDAVPSDRELTVIPVVGGDSDIGLGAGYLMSLADLSGGVKPYVWRLEAGGAISATFQGSPELSYLDNYLIFTVPYALGGRVHFEGYASYTIEPQLNYFGVGNASELTPGYGPSDEFHQYERAYTIARAMARYRLHPSLMFLWGVAHTRSEVSYLPGTRIDQDLNSPKAPVGEIVRSTAEHQAVQFSYGVEWDDRDDAVATHKGHFHSVIVDFNPGGAYHFPFSWGRLDVTTRGYHPIVKNRLTIAGRLVLDALFGEPPFYELSRLRDTQAIGGGRGLRGVPAGRYYGMVKIFSNLELRSELFGFDFLNKHNIFGLTGFLDMGRVFAHYESEPELDGDGLGLKYGIGGGIRLTAGRSFVVRADVAWSPDADPIGAYLLAGHPF